MWWGCDLAWFSDSGRWIHPSARAISGLSGGARAAIARRAAARKLRPVSGRHVQASRPARGRCPVSASSLVMCHSNLQVHSWDSHGARPRNGQIGPAPVQRVRNPWPLARRAWRVSVTHVTPVTRPCSCHFADPARSVVRRIRTGSTVCTVGFPNGAAHTPKRTSGLGAGYGG
jgi:hypothetical protein